MSRRTFVGAILSMLLLLTAAPMPLASAETYTVKEGDTLWDLARIKYGDPTLWTDIAKANNISNPKTIPNGTVLTLPSKATLLKLRGVTDPAERAKLIKEDGAGGTTGSPTPPAPTGPTPFDPISGLGARTEVPHSSAPAR
ncbi:MAG: LysM peptidoglycan-binding domain-containing protein [Candidatus Wallbacteria bacterium]|nr:LysM peptidoglycan-binding domain-containing protein [Candidatus Wallbacteria bacterium]